MNRIIRVGAYAAIQQQGHLLLCRLTRSGLWTLPGGGIEFGETPEQAMVREVKEETGLIATPNELIGVNSFVATRIDEVHFVQIIYTAEVAEGNLQAEVDGTTDECAWHPWETVTILDTTPALKYLLNQVNP